tara:strand:+ start:1841 stop:3025 length:1185 start_codon:yes stop_codon:yes gene_type:complete
MSFDLNMHTSRLLTSEPFFAALSRRVSKIADESIPTAGVRVNPDSGQFEMFYNPKFFESLSDIEKRGVLKHEFYHLVFEHVTGRLPDEGMSKMWNIATDLAINSHLLGELPDFALYPGKDHFAEYPLGQSSEWYMEKLKQDQEKEKEEGKGQSQPGEGGEDGKGEPQPLDDHSGWREMSDAKRQMAQQRAKEIMKQAAEEANKAGSWGSVPSLMKKEIISKISTQVDWRKVLRYFIKTSQRSSKRNSIKKINKRYAYVHPGRKVNRTAKVAISIDQSGSVNDQMLTAFFAELSNLAKYAEFTVVPFDTAVAEDAVYVWKRGERKKAQRVRYGGTNFDAPTKWVNERNFDGHIVLTDMMAPKPVASKCQRMWVTTAYYAKRPYFKTNEKIIAINP